MPLPENLQTEQATRAPTDDVRHPGWDATIESIYASYRHAERGFPRLMFDVIDDRTRPDGKLRGMIEARTSAITGSQTFILPGGTEPDDIRAATMLRESIDEHEIDLQRYLAHAERSPLMYGYGLVEQMWEWNQRESRYDVVELHHIRSRNTGIATSHSRHIPGTLPDDIVIQTGPHEHEVEAQTPFKYIEIRGTHEEPAVWAGLGHTSTLWSTLKMQGFAGWLAFVDRYGLPFLTVTVGDWTSEEDKATAREIIQRFGRDGGVMLPKNGKIKVEVHDGIQGSRNATSDVHERFAQACDQENGITWNGTTMATQTGQAGSSFALANAQSNVEFRLSLADKARIESATRNQWFRRWMRFNSLPGATPMLNIFVERIVDPAKAVAMAKTLSEIGYQVEPAQLMAITGLRQDTSSPANDNDGDTGGDDGEE